MEFNCRFFVDGWSVVEKPPTTHPCILERVKAPHRGSSLSYLTSAREHGPQSSPIPCKQHSTHVQTAQGLLKDDYAGMMPGNSRDAVNSQNLLEMDFDFVSSYVLLSWDAKDSSINRTNPTELSTNVRLRHIVLA